MIIGRPFWNVFVRSRTIKNAHSEIQENYVDNVIMKFTHTRTKTPIQERKTTDKYEENSFSTILI